MNRKTDEEIEAQTTATFVYPSTGDPYILTRDGRRHSVSKGMQLRARFGSNPRTPEYAWLEDNVGPEAKKRETALEELERRLLPAVRFFLERAIEVSPRVGDGLISKLVVEVGLEGYDAEDAPDFLVQVEESHGREV